MSNPKALEQEVVAHSRKGPHGVLYLEGKSDVEVFFALLGVERPTGDLHERVFVCGLQDDKRGRAPGSGKSAVRARVECAQKLGLGRVWGVVDGDGAPLEETRRAFDAPHPGPLFVWKAYCIENLLAQAPGWPKAWGPRPDWSEVLRVYAPYVALNGVHLHLQNTLKTLSLDKFSHPHPQHPLLNAQEVLLGLEQDKDLLRGVDVAARFGAEHSAFLDALDASLDEAHARLNGKWFLRHFAPTRARDALGAVHAEERCAEVWREAVRSAGGHPEVRRLWGRLTGRAS
jgi:hypothetical protein